MRWLADECLPHALVEQLRSDGHDVLFIADALGGSGDEFILDLAQAENRLLLTHDSDFGDLLFRRHDLTAPGVVFLRFRAGQRELRWPRLKHVIDSMGSDLYGRFVVITHSRTRWRKLEPDR